MAPDARARRAQHRDRAQPFALAVVLGGHVLDGSARRARQVAGLGRRGLGHGAYHGRIRPGTLHYHHTQRLKYSHKCSRGGSEPPNVNWIDLSKLQGPSHFCHLIRFR